MSADNLVSNPPSRTKRFTEAIELSVHKGAIAHYNVALAVLALYENQWVYLPSMGWRVSFTFDGASLGALLTGENALMFIRRLLSEAVATQYERYAAELKSTAEASFGDSRTELFQLSDRAYEIALNLCNADYKTKVIEECACVFTD